ncbi:MAG: hypothetical protein COU29_02510 [Candidatus Magasanikbacteria bacterium CG10_big_fil_rev_8_21_14_0_10_36_32]|uniref:Type II secretion system protein J n=1 Tax=Candidatus Magasanikbacteria bacterium CG10_big_fil_rev_8_21_14_0_10_36_32 TaxID=1974646 RepID=A0A2M6W739_9BACT|nr:MAG: hypothetical protein COU29_02510 [Candidatus Magasanikbacteria bacterium CG10_big_fil_rev_8_21_14_0_10_36_32]
MKLFCQDKRGLTLIELLVSIGIFVLVSAALASILSVVFQARTIIWEQLSTQKEGRQIVQDFTNELRSATASSIGAYSLESAQNDEIIFYSNIDSDSWRERIRYFLSDGILQKGITKPSGTPLGYSTSTDEVITEMIHDVINGTTTPVFYYYDENYTGSENPMTLPIVLSEVRVVGIKLILEENPRMSPAPLQVETKAQIRNLKSN